MDLLRLTLLARQAVVLGCAVGLLLAAAPAMAGWSTPAAVPLPTGAAAWFGGGDNVTIAPLPDGTVVAAVNATVGGGASRPAAAVLSGGVWTTEYLDAADADDPVVSWDGTGKAVAVWRKPVGGRVEVLAARREANGTWVSEGTISGSLDVRYKLQDVSRGPNGDIAVGLCPGRVPTVVRRVNGVWSAPATVPGTGLDCDDGRIYFGVAQDALGGTWVRANVNYTMRVAYLDPNGTWQHQENLTAGGSDSNNQQLVVTGDGTPVAMWTTMAGAVTSRARTGGAWGIPEIVDATGTQTQAGVRLAASPVSGVAAGGWAQRSCGFMCMSFSTTAKGAGRANGAWSSTRLFNATPSTAIGVPVPAVDAMGGTHHLMTNAGALSAVDRDGTASTVAATGASTVRGVIGDQLGRIVAVWSTSGSGYMASVLTQAPAAPTGVTATATGTTTIDVAWTAPTITGGEAIADYVVTTTPASSACAAVATTSCTLTGLAPGTAYAITVKARNAVGTGPETSAATATTSAASTPNPPSQGDAPAPAPNPGDVTPEDEGLAASTTQAPVRILGSRSVGGRSLALSIRVPGPGRITVVGRRLAGTRAGGAVCRTSVKVTTAGTKTVACALTKAGRTAAATDGMRVRITLTYVGEDGQTGTASRIARVDPPATTPSAVTG